MEPWKCGLEIPRVIDRLSESLEAESGIGGGQHLEKWGNRLRGASESRVICSLKIPRGYFGRKGGAKIRKGLAKSDATCYTVG